MKALKHILTFAIVAVALCFAVHEASAQPATLRSDAWMTDGQVFDIVHSDGITYIGGQFNFVTMFTGNGAALSMRTATPLPQPRVNGTIFAVIPDGAGGWYIGGSFTRVDDFVRNNLAHIFANGTLDVTWSPEVSGGSNRILALALHGKAVYVGGDFAQISGQPRSNIAALDATTGQVITSWDPNANGVVRALALDGTIIYAGGAFSNIGGLARNRIAALDSATGTATPWNPNLSGGDVLTLDVSGSTVYAGGTFTTIGAGATAQTRNRIAAIDAVTGNPLPWNPNATGAVRALVVSNNTVYAGGDFATIGGRARNRIAALDATGRSTDWNPNAIGSPPFSDGAVFALAINGAAIFVGGRFTNIGTEPRRFVAAIDANTGTALPWNPNVSTVIPSTVTPPPTLFTSTDTAHVYALAINGLTLYAGGSIRTSGWRPRSNVAAFDASTGRPAAWNPNANGAVRALAVSEAIVYAGGTFTSIGGAVRSRLAALDAVTGLATAWNPNVDGAEINTIDVEKGTVYVGGSFTTISGQSRSNVAALDAVTGSAIPWTNPPTLNGPVRSLAVRGTVIYLGGDFTGLDSPPRNLLAALDAETGLLTPWNPNAGGGASPSVQTLAVSGSTVYAGGRFTMVGGQSRNVIAAIDAASGIPTAWNPNVTGLSTATGPIVRAITVSGDTVYFGGEFNRAGNETRNNVAAVSAASAIPTTWNLNALFSPAITTAFVSALEVGGSTVFVGGNFNNIAGMTHTFFAPFGETPLNPVPVVAGMNPTIGKRLQTLEVTFEGANFVDDVSSVNVGRGIAVNSITVNSATSLTANITISANASTGVRNFSVTNHPPGGGTSSPFAFTIINPAPTVASIAPASGFRRQTLDVTVTGSNFISGVSTVSFGTDITVNSIIVNSATRMTANITISANAALGARDVTVSNAFPGGGTATLARTFAVGHAIPTLISLEPDNGNRLQTLDVVFTGAGFIEGITTVNTEPGITINSITVTSATSLTANLTITAKAATGPRAFSVSIAGPGGGASESKTFTITNPEPTLTGINPESGGRGETIEVFLKGTNFFSDASTVSLGADIVVNFVAVNSDTQITANITIPIDIALGDRDVSVTNAAPGGGTATIENGFFVKNPRPTLISVTPTIGSLGQTLSVDLIGSNFIEGVSQVDFGEGITVNAMTVLSSTQITANITIEAWATLGAHDVTVTNDEPGGSATLPKAFAVSSGSIVQFSVPTDLQGSAGDTVEIPLQIDPAGRKVGSFDAKLGFDPEVLTYIDFTSGPILSGADWQIDVNPGSEAINLGAFVANASLTQAGTAIVLLFRVREAAKPGTTVPLILSNLAATTANANALPTEGTDGLFTVSLEARISGQLFYFINNKPLAGDTVQIEVADPETRFQVSDEDGFFEFDGLPLGSTIFLTPRRVAGNFPAETITAGDALKAFKGRAGGPEPLNGYESLAADVTGDCQLTSGDALATLKRATGNWENFRRFGRDDWRFVDASFNITAENWCDAPQSRVYDPLTENKQNQNFIGVILGDVNGSFGAALDKIAKGEDRNGPVVAISDPLFNIGSEQIDFAVEVSRANNAYNSFDLMLTFEAAVHVTNVSLGTMLTPEDWQMDWNARQPGVLRIAGFSMSEASIKGSGELVIIHAALAQPAKAGESFSLDMPSALFGMNGKETLAQTEARNLKITARPPQQYALEQNYPNPFSRGTPASKTVIKYSLPAAEMVSLRIYDMLGHTVRTLVSEPQQAGIHTSVWNGRKDDGTPAATGVYLYRLEAGTFTKTNKLILQK
jgi:hypothetical protein